MRLPTPGETFHGKYVIQRLLGKGGYASVFLATEPQIGRDVAIKILSPEGTGYSDAVGSRFQREARILAGLQDPHTITMYEFGQTAEGLLFMVFEYVRGTDLHDLVRQRGKLTPTAAAHVLRQCLEALREAHEAGILHRDIKPANILVYEYMRDPYRAKVLDFGIAKPVQPRMDVETITRTGSVIGTPRYMSPEQLCGEDLSPASDLYSLGLVMWEMLVGLPAIDGTDTKAMIQRQLNHEPIRLPGTLELPAALRAIVERMVAKSQTQRFQTADEVLNALRAVSTSGITTGTGPLAPQEQAPPASMGSTIAVVVLGLVAGVGLIIGLLTLVSGEDERVREPPPVVPRDEVADPRAEPLPDPRPATVEPPPAVTAMQKPPPETEVVILDVDAGAPTPGPAALRAFHGCGRAAPFEGRRKFAVRVHGQARSYWTYLPEGYDQNKRHPVVLAFHQALNDGSRFIDELRDAADDGGFVVIAPDGTDAISPWKNEPTDVPLTMEALESMSEVLCLDPTKIFAIGMASGTRVTDRLPCRMPLSGVAISGDRTNKSPGCARKPPMMTVSGKDDPYLPLAGGVACNGDREASLAAHDETWKQQNECTGEKRVYRKTRHGTCYTWDCEAGAYVSCVVQGGHYWPLGKGATLEWPQCRDTPTKFDYAGEIWRFFEKDGVAITEPIDFGGTER